RNMRIILRVEVITIVANDFLHRHVNVVTNSGRFGATILVNDGKFIAITKIDKTFAMTSEMHGNAAMLIVIIGLRRAIRVGEAETTRIIVDDLWVVSCVTTLTAIRRRPVRLFKF